MHLSTIFRNSAGKGFPLSLSESVGLLSILAFVAWSAYVSWAQAGYESALAFILYGWLFYLVRVFYCWIARKDFPKAREFALAFVRKVGTFVLAIAIVLGSFACYQNELNPAKLPEYVISNGEKTVRFRWMAHIASQGFYDGVKEDIANARKEGYVLFYEGVRPGTPENAKKFDALMGFKFDKKLYDSMSKLYGLVPQKQEEIAGTPDPRDRNVDVSVDDIIAAYEKRKGPVSSEAEPSKASEAEELSVNLSEELAKQAESLNDRELFLVQYLNRAVMGMVIKNRDAWEAAFAGLGKVDLFSSILHDRNVVLADAIASTEEKKIFVTYGLLHFDGTFYLLQEKDSRWKMVEPPKNRYPTLP